MLTHLNPELKHGTQGNMYGNFDLFYHINLGLSIF